MLQGNWVSLYCYRNKKLKANRKTTFNNPSKTTSNLIWHILRVKHPARQHWLNSLSKDQLKRCQQSHHKREPSNSKMATNRILWDLGFHIAMDGSWIYWFLPYKNLGKIFMIIFPSYLQKINNYSLVWVNKKDDSLWVCSWLPLLGHRKTISRVNHLNKYHISFKRLWKDAPTKNILFAILPQWLNFYQH